MHKMVLMCECLSYSESLTLGDPWLCQKKKKNQSALQRSSSIINEDQELFLLQVTET